MTSGTQYPWATQVALLDARKALWLIIEECTCIVSEISTNVRARVKTQKPCIQKCIYIVNCAHKRIYIVNRAHKRIYILNRAQKRIYTVNHAIKCV